MRWNHYYIGEFEQPTWKCRVSKVFFVQRLANDGGQKNTCPPYEKLKIFFLTTRFKKSDFFKNRISNVFISKKIVYHDLTNKRFRAIIKGKHTGLPLQT